MATPQDAPVIITETPSFDISSTRNINAINEELPVDETLCGWLHMTIPGGLVPGRSEAPRKRWFIFDDNLHVLEYYRNPKDLNRLGVISIQDAAFTSSSMRENDNLYSMDITTSKRAFRLLHGDLATLTFWRQSLQKKRSLIQEALLEEVPMLALPSTLSRSTSSICSRKSEIFGRKSSGLLRPHLEVESEVYESNRNVGPHTKDLIEESQPNESEIGNRFRSLANIFLRTTPIIQLLKGPDRNFVRSPSPSSSPATTQQESSVAALSSTPSTGSVSGNSSKPIYCEQCRTITDGKKYFEDKLRSYENQIDSLKATLLVLSKGEDTVKVEENTTNIMSKRLCDLELECNQLRGEIRARDEVIERHTSHELSKKEDQEKITALTSQISSLKMERDAYLDQNKSLNAEILNLRLLYSASVEHESEMIEAITKLHEVYKESHMTLKRRVTEITASQIGDDVASPNVEKDRLTELTNAIDDVCIGEPAFPDHLRKVLLSSSGDLTDSYGFYVERRDLTSDEMINLTNLGADVNLSYFLEIPDVNQEKDEILTANWERYLLENATNEDGSIKPFKKIHSLKLFLRQGCTQKVRPRVWTAMILFYVNNYREMNGGEAIYKGLVAQQEKSTTLNIERKQIELDVNRSLPENKYFNITRVTNSDELKISSLKRVLLSFCEISDKVGYCQGLDRIAATLLLNVNEEMSFWGLHVIVRRLRSENYYTSSLRDAQIDQRVFKDLIASHVPNVSKRLTELNVDITVFSFNWFLTLFVDGFHWSVFMKIWDSFLFEGDKILFRYGIAVVIYLEPILLKVPDSAHIYRVLRNAGKYVKDHRRLTQIAFGSLKSFPKRRITQKRQHYSVIVDKEIEKVTEERAKIRQKSNLFRAAMFSNESEDED